MDGAVDEDTTGELGVFDEETRGVELVAGLGAEDAGGADQAVVHLVEGVTVGGVEAAGETAHDFLVGELLNGFIFGVDDGLGLLFHDN